MIKIILIVCAVILFMAALFTANISVNTSSQEKNYRHDAYQLISLSNYKEVAGEGKLHDIYNIILMDNFVSKEEFDMFYEEVLIVYPHIKKFDLNLRK